MVNRGEEEVRVHMNVVPRGTRNTKGSGLILCSTNCVPSATPHIKYMLILILISMVSYSYKCIWSLTDHIHDHKIQKL